MIKESCTFYNGQFLTSNRENITDIKYNERYMDKNVFNLKVV